jgi:predicted nucleotidyltransferase
MAKESRKITETIAELKEKVSREYRAEVVGVFGSYARGEQKAGSDVFHLYRAAGIIDTRLRLR